MAVNIRPKPKQATRSSSLLEAGVTAGRLAYWAADAGVLWPLLLVLVAFVFVAGFVMTVAAVATQSSLSSNNNAATTAVYSGPPSALAQSLIPPVMLALYQSPLVHSECPTLSWTVVAALTHLESGDGSNANASSAGAMGPNQFEPTTWDKSGLTVVNVPPNGQVPDGQGYGVDGNGDGLADIMNPEDSVPAAARYLCANGGGNPATLPKALFAYNHAWWYVYGGIDDQGTYFQGVLPLAQQLADTASVSGKAQVALQAAATQIGVQYVWGGEAPGQGFDCSGLVQWALEQAGVSWVAGARTSEAQYASLQQYLVPENQAQPGDLVFFVGGDGAPPGHVGIVLDPTAGTMIDAPHTGAAIRIESYRTFGGFMGIANPYLLG